MRSNETAEEEGRRLVAAISARGGDAAEFLLPLVPEDYHVTGVVIQWTAYALFAAQQLIDHVEEKRGSPVRPVNSSLRDNNVLPLLEKYVEDLHVTDEERESVSKALAMIQSMMDIRHIMAHMALRRHPDADALIGLSLRRKENFRRALIEPKYGQAMVAYIPMPEVRANFQPLERNVNYLASLYVRLAKGTT